MAHWVEPIFVAEIEFAGWTRDEVVRQAAFLGIRPDKVATDVIREDAAVPKRRGERADSMATEAAPEIVKLTHPERVIFPDQRLTKADLAEYYEWIGNRMLPYVKDRLLTLYRCPDGVTKKCFVQRHHNDNLPDVMYRFDVQGAKEKEPYVYIREAQGLRALVQISAIEIHGWGSTTHDVEKPDQLVFDLDPDPGFTWTRVKRAAEDLREILRALKMKPFLKTTGGKGLHVVVPIEPTVKWPEIKEFCKLIAEDFARRDDGSYTTNMRKAERSGKLFLDYLRNDRSATAIIPYSVRARAGAPVAVPIDWAHLRTLRAPNAFTVRNVREKLERIRKDPWAAFNDSRLDLRKVVK